MKAPAAQDSAWAPAGIRRYALHETPPQPPPPPRLLDRVRRAIRIHHFSRRTEKAYVAWSRRFILFHGKRHPSEMGESEITQYLSSLATDRNVSASTQNQALSAILFTLPCGSRPEGCLARWNRQGQGAKAVTGRPQPRGSANRLELPAR